MTVKRVVECNNCRTQHVLTDFPNHFDEVTEFGWVILQTGEKGARPLHFCATECLIKFCEEMK
jgi:hypothetical protein